MKKEDIYSEVMKWISGKSCINCFDNESLTEIRKYQNNLIEFRIIFNTEPNEKIKAMESKQIEEINNYGLQGVSLENILRNTYKEKK